MKRTEKEQLVTELTDKIKGASAVYYTDFTGLNVKRMTELRRRLRKAGVEYVVIKNTLALRAVNESGLAGSRLRGPTGIVVGEGCRCGGQGPQRLREGERAEARGEGRHARWQGDRGGAGAATRVDSPRGSNCWLNSGPALCPRWRRSSVP